MAAKKKAKGKKTTGSKRSGAKRSGAKKSGAKRTGRRAAAKRELIAPRGNKRYVRRDPRGRIKESDDLSRSLSTDRRRKAKTKVKSGQGDRGDG